MPSQIESGKQVENIFGTELSPVMPFELMDAGVMSVLHYNQVRKDVISRITVDVMNDLDTYKLSAEDILSNNSGESFSNTHRSEIQDRAFFAQRA